MKDLFYVTADGGIGFLSGEIVELPNGAVEITADKAQNLYALDIDSINVEAKKLFKKVK